MYVLKWYTIRVARFGLWSAYKQMDVSPVRVDLDVDGSVALRAPLLGERESLQQVGQTGDGYASHIF